MGNEKKVKTRDLKLKDHNISNAKYNELKYFCMQYEEKRQELSRGYYIGGISYDRGSRKNDFSKPTEDRAIKNVMLEKDIELIEKTAKETDESMYPYIIKNICYGIPYENMPVPAGRRQFYEIRRYFFYLLSRKR